MLMVEPRTSVAAIILALRGQQTAPLEQIEALIDLYGKS